MKSKTAQLQPPIADPARNPAQSRCAADCFRCEPYLGSIGVEVGGAGATFCCCTLGAGGVGSVTPLRPSLKPFKPLPSPLPNSGSRLAPNSRNATTARTSRCHG